MQLKIFLLYATPKMHMYKQKPVVFFLFHSLTILILKEELKSLIVLFY